MNGSSWINPGVACVSPPIGASQADPKLSSAVLDLDSSEGWRAVFAGFWRTSPGGRLFV